MKSRNIGSIMLCPDKVPIQYSNSIFNMQIPGNDVYTLLLIGFIKKHVSCFGCVTASLDFIVKECGYYTKGNSKENNQYFRNALIRMINEKYLSLEENISIDTIKNSELFNMHMNPDKDLFIPMDKFVVISVGDFNRITSLIEKHTKTGIILNTYLAIKQYIFSNGDLAYPSKNSISKYIGMSSSTVDNAINDLLSLELLFVSDNYFIKNKDGTDTYVRTRKLYALEKSAFKTAKHTLSQLYNGADVYDYDEIDSTKIIRLR